MYNVRIFIGLRKSIFNVARIDSLKMFYEYSNILYT